MKRISIKTSGHSYSGSSSLADTVLINLARFPKYACQNNSSAIHECTEADLRDSEDGMSPGDVSSICRLAKARGKQAYLRVGGGQYWDEVYRDVYTWNKNPRN